MKNESDEDLLVIISMKDDKSSSDKAFAEFYSRFKGFMYNALYKVTENLPNSEELRNVVFQNTFIGKALFTRFRTLYEIILLNYEVTTNGQTNNLKRLIAPDL